MTAAMSLTESIDTSRVIHRRYAVLLLYGLSAFWGVGQVVSPNNPLLYIASAIAFATSATLWFSIDRRILAKPRLPVLQLLFFFTWPAASLIHLLASRGLRGFGYWLLHSVGMFMTMCVTFFPAMLLLHWFGILDLDALNEM
ncbi:hypothetical protein [Allorhodopirellula heiligendammensis]|uniref:Uncharacterized protein n=1 Tax=Allorhodopirellula heiligendammensis TaxID=2714739 RepID=A0A5C6B0J9_9BACT|nr:hypothetical protein [Allorhodopirellula heiligendammensis]TWU05430.1 hypothetical protein Poly21_56700 [Allorhodopirellula heiligendammensis]